MLDPRRTLAVICGAQSWPHLAHVDPAVAFHNSATALRAYLGDAEGAGLPDENVLWLFDEPNAVAHYERIAAFLTARLAVLDAPQGADTLVLFAYVGHGTLFGQAKEYCLLVTDTRAPIEADTSLRLSALAGLLRACAPRSSRLLLLGCCFAGVAATYFYQSGGPREIASVKAAEVVRATPGTGAWRSCAPPAPWTVPAWPTPRPSSCSTANCSRFSPPVIRTPPVRSAPAESATSSTPRCSPPVRSTRRVPRFTSPTRAAATWAMPRSFRTGPRPGPPMTAPARWCGRRSSTG